MFLLSASCSDSLSGKFMFAFIYLYIIYHGGSLDCTTTNSFVFLHRWQQMKSESDEIGKVYSCYSGNVAFNVATHFVISSFRYPTVHCERWSHCSATLESLVSDSYVDCGRLLCTHKFKLCVGVLGWGGRVMQDAQRGPFLRVGHAAVQTVSSGVSCEVVGDCCFRLVGWTGLQSY